MPFRDLWLYGKIQLGTLTSDPTIVELNEGHFWYRSDLDLLSYSPDGKTARRIPYGDDTYDLYADTIAEKTTGAGITFKHLTILDNVDEIFEALDADATNATRDSSSAILRGKYWDGVASVDRDADIFHDIIDTTPTSQIGFEIAGTRLINFVDDGDIDLASQSVIATAGTLAGYATIKVGGTQYKIALYLTS